MGPNRMGCEVLAVSSSGGHWVELSRLMPAFEGLSVEFVTTDSACAVAFPSVCVHVVTDASRWTPWRLILCFMQLVRLILGIRPRIIVTTGAAPGLFAVVIGKFFGVSTVWIDTVASVERMSMSGRIAQPFADLCLVQWPHLAGRDGPHFRGSVL